jgi:hypothetical protein
MAKSQNMRTQGITTPHPENLGAVVAEEKLQFYLVTMKNYFGIRFLMRKAILGMQ